MSKHDRLMFAAIGIAVLEIGFQVWSIL